MNKQSRFIGGVLLIAGTAIGIGMLALPLTTGTGGFKGAFIGTTLWYLYMLMTMLIFIDALYLDRNKNGNLISLIRQEFSYKYEIMTWLCFLGLLYAATTAYILGGGQIISAVLSINHVDFEAHWASVIFTSILGLTVFYGMQWVDNINRALMITLITSFILLLIVTSIHGDTSNLASGGQPLYLLAASPTIVLAFAPHPIIPSLRKYLQNNKKTLRNVMITGSLIPLVCYLVWETVVISLIPYNGANSLVSIIHNAAEYGGELKLLSQTLHKRYHIPVLDTLVNSFALSAIITSFIGVTLSVTDFIYDGLQLSKHKNGRTYAILGALLPPMLIGYLCPNGFLSLISYGGVMIAILYGIFPPLMLLKRHTSTRKKYILISCIVIAFIVIILQIASAQNLLPTAHDLPKQSYY